MNLWSMLVLAVLKQGLDCGFDRLAHIANNDGLVRQMMEHENMDHQYELQTVIDNVSLLGPELLTEISALVARRATRYYKKSLASRCALLTTLCNLIQSARQS